MRTVGKFSRRVALKEQKERAADKRERRINEGE